MNQVNSIWVITDGKAGDTKPAIGLARAIGVEPQLRLISPGKLFAWFMPWGSIDFRDKVSKANSPLKPPYPDMAIASGRRAFAYLRTLKRLSPMTFTVFLKNPKASTHSIDVVWAPEHDKLKGDNVITTLTTPHHISKDLLAQARNSPLPSLAKLGRPRVAVIIGGDNSRFAYSQADLEAMLTAINHIVASELAHLMITSSRRTPEFIKLKFERLFKPPTHFFWDGTGSNPYIDILALADAIVVTGDSTNMLAEALATGCPVYVYKPFAFPRHGRLAYYLEQLIARSMVKLLPVTGKQTAQQTITFTRQAAVDATETIASQIIDRYNHQRATAIINH